MEFLDKYGTNILTVLLVAAALMLISNSLQLATIKGFSGNSGNNLVGGSESLGVIPTGVPAVYGNELGISYDDVSPDDANKADRTINKLGQMDQAIQLTGNDLERYINVLYKLENGISCEYCCGARSVIFESGESACGCAHSYAMRGLAKYLITQHGDEYTDEELLEEIGKWKTLFFPTIIEQKAAILKEKGIELNYINLASNKYRGIEKGASSGGSMVGGC